MESRASWGVVGMGRIFSLEGCVSGVYWSEPLGLDHRNVHFRSIGPETNPARVCDLFCEVERSEVPPLFSSWFVPFPLIITDVVVCCCCCCCCCFLTLNGSDPNPCSRPLSNFTEAKVISRMVPPRFHWFFHHVRQEIPDEFFPSLFKRNAQSSLELKYSNFASVLRKVWEKYGNQSEPFLSWQLTTLISEWVKNHLPGDLLVSHLRPARASRPQELWLN